METHHHVNGEYVVRIKPRNGCTSWDIFPLGAGPAVALGFESKKAAIGWFDQQIERASEQSSPKEIEE